MLSVTCHTSINKLITLNINILCNNLGCEKCVHFPVKLQYCSLNGQDMIRYGKKNIR